MAINLCPLSRMLADVVEADRPASNKFENKGMRN